MSFLFLFSQLSILYSTFVATLRSSFYPLLSSCVVPIKSGSLSKGRTLIRSDLYSSFLMRSFCFLFFSCMSSSRCMFFYLAFDHLTCIPDLGQVVHIRQCVYLLYHIEKTIIIFCSCFCDHTFFIFYITKYNCFSRTSLHTCSLCFTICQRSVCFLCIQFCFLQTLNAE